MHFLAAPPRTLGLRHVVASALISPCIPASSQCTLPAASSRSALLPPLSLLTLLAVSAPTSWSSSSIFPTQELCGNYSLCLESQLILIIHIFCICQFTYTLKFTCNGKILAVLSRSLADERGTVKNLSHRHAHPELRSKK